MKRFFLLLLGVVVLFSGCRLSPAETVKEIVEEMPEVEELPFANREAQEQTEENTAETTAETTPVPSLPLSGKRLLIDPGHGLNSDTGTEAIAPGSAEKKRAFVSGASGKNQTEEELNLAVGLKLRDALTALGAEVHMTREGHETTRSNVGRAEQGNELGVDLSVKLHADGSSSRSVYGASILIPGDAYIKDRAMLAESRRAAECILAEYVKSTGAKNNGVVVRNDMTGFNWSKVPVVLLEMGFMSNPEEDALMATSAYQKKMAKGVANGIDRYIKER